MSTNINISVGGNKLLDQARLQQNASRRSQLEKEADKRLEDKATKARTKALEGAGLAANGSSLIGPPSTNTELNNRPAASRSKRYYVGEVYSITTGSTRSGRVSITIVTESGSEYNFTLATTFAYPDTDVKSSTGNEAITLGDFADYYEPPGSIDDYDFFADPTTLDVGAAPFFGAQFTKTVILKAASTADFFNDFILLLPAGKDACVIVSVGKGIRQRATIERVQTDTHYYVEYIDYDETNDPPAPPKTRWRHDYSYNYSSKPLVTNSDSYQWIKCFYTTKDTCKEISAPPGLYELLKDYVDDVTVSAVWQYDYNTYILGRFGEDYTEIVGAFSDKLDAGAWVRSVIQAPYFTDKFRLYGLFATNDGSAVTTPGVYKTIQLDANDDRFSDPYNSDLTSVSYMVNTFYGGSYSDLPRFGLQYSDVFIPEYDPKYRRHDSTVERPTYNGNIPVSDLDKDEEVRTFTRDFLFWDWNNPEYCREQLLALGFIAADLTP